MSNMTADRPHWSPLSRNEEPVLYMPPRTHRIPLVNLPTINEWKTEHRTIYFNHRDSFDISKCPRLPNPSRSDNDTWTHNIKHKNSLDLNTVKCPRTPEGRRRRLLQSRKMRQEASLRYETLTITSEDLYRKEGKLKYLPGYGDTFTEHYESTRVSRGSSKCCLKQFAEFCKRSLGGGPAVKGDGIAPAF